MPDRRFVLLVRDKSDVLVDASHLKADSLDGAAVIGHAFQAQNGYSVTILDRLTNTEYGIDWKGKPIHIFK